MYIYIYIYIYICIYICIYTYKLPSCGVQMYDHAPVETIQMVDVAKVQGYLAHKKHPPLGPYSSPMHMALWWS